MTDAVTFMRNCNAHSDEEMQKYHGYNIAWSEDGTRILAHAKELEDLLGELDRQGIKEYVVQFYPDV